MIRNLGVLTLAVWASSAIFAADPITEQDQRFRHGGLSPEESLSKMIVADDLAIDQLLSEPTVRQPVFLNFDERGRLWVVQYMQYPHPAGLKIISHDRYWRNVYDKVPAAPPNHVRGKDQITIHEDTDGDGVYDTHKTFLDGLNMVTSLEHGRGGVWVLNPPYLLFYPDKNRDDVPDGDPVVHLAGFGLEDSHSIANSLRWGPDGWLYGAQGSTVTANLVRPGFDERPIYSQGQNIWRYHPESRRYEVFAEGGGNAFGVEIDTVGRIFSGHNGGNTRGFHYPQGGYLRKGFTKHGPLSNPYAFGYFDGMPHHDVERFTHNFVIYEGASLPDHYDGKLFGVEPIQGRVVVAEIESTGGSFRTSDVSRPLTSEDDWFRPVDIKVGPDGAVYLCDWYDGNVGHYRSHEGNLDPTNGRIYRLRSQGQPKQVAFDLANLSSDELVDYLGHPNRWFRQTSLRVLADRKDSTTVPRLRALMDQETGQLALEAFWALHAVRGLEPSLVDRALRHENPHVRVWAVRLLGDGRSVTPAVAGRLARLASGEKHIEVRQQLACSARRLPSDQGMPIVAELLKYDEDAADPYQPLIVWWAIETFCRESPNQVVGLLDRDSPLWAKKLVKDTVLHRLMQRFAMEGTRQDLLRCASLLGQAKAWDARKRLMAGFEEAYRGRPLTNLPDELAYQIMRAGGGSLVLRLRRRDANAIREALEKISEKKDALEKRLEYVALCGELQLDGAPEVLLRTLQDGDAEPEIRHAVFGALQAFDDDGIPLAVVGMYAKLADEHQTAAQSLFVSRIGWAKMMMEAIDEGLIDPLSVSIESLRKCLVFDDDGLKDAVTRRWGDVAGAASDTMKNEVNRVTKLLGQQFGDPYAGQKLYRQNCGKCHKLFTDGGEIGPDLTTYQRDDAQAMVLNIVNPNAEIREGFENYLVLTTDGRVVTGLMVERDNKVVVLRTAEGHTVAIDREDIEDSRVLGHSLMPEGLLRKYSDDEIVDLFAYLRSTQPLNN